MISGPDPRASFTRSQLGRLAALRAAVSVAVLLAGFRAVSDDDYSRVVIAQAWARAPRLDPSGTSWLPFPFWLNGAAMLAFGRSLLVAQAVAFALGIASTLLVAHAALRLTGDRRAAFLAGAFTTLIGWSAWLGVATVPECLTAALTFFAAASLATGSVRVRFLGALALVAATLSRYEPWPVACAFAAWNAIDLHVRWGRAHGKQARPASVGETRHRGDDREPHSDRVRAVIVANAISATALVGPAAWIAWNRLTRGDAFEFVARVTAYRRALGDTSSESILARLAAYPLALAKELPEVAIPFAIALLFAAVPRLRPVIAARLRRHAAPLSLAAVQIVALAVALVKDGAPTHHPERAVLFPALAMAVFVADVAAGLASLLPRAATGSASHLPRAATGPASRLPRVIAILAGAALFVRAAATPLLDRGGFAHRESEVEVGALVAAKTPPGARVLIQAVDYGYFAIEAASGRPEAFELDRNLDPRAPVLAPVFLGDDDFGAWLRARRLDYVVSPRDEERPLGWRFPDSESFPTTRHALSKVPSAR